MPSFSNTSLKRLETCHPDIQKLMRAVIQKVDFSVLCGHRNQEEQDQAVANKASKTPWPTSKHNSLPSLAIDIAPVPLDWKKPQAFKDLAHIVLVTAAELGIKIRWGGDWNSNGVEDESFYDLPHFELRK
jgi:hypothetical protein